MSCLPRLASSRITAVVVSCALWTAWAAPGLAASSAERVPSVSSQAAPSEGAAKNHERAQEAYKQGAAAYASGRYLEAAHWFQQADHYEPDGRLCYNIALAFESLNSTADALRWYRDYLRRVPGAEDRAEVERAVRRLEAKLAASGVQQLTVLSSPDGARIILDGQLMGTTPWTGETTPGRHRVILRLEGHEDVTNDLELPADRAQEVSLTFGGGEAAPRNPAAEVRASSVSRVAPLTWVTLGVGVAALGTSALFEASRASAEQDARAADDQRAAESAFDRMESRQLAARLFLGAGVAVTAVGGYLLWRDLSTDSTATVGAACAPGACGVVARGVF